jgi:hypothetical protein
MRTQARDIARGGRIVRLFLSQDQLDAIADATCNEFQAETITKGHKASRRDIVKRVKGQVKTFGIEFLILAIVGWIIGKILDYLWDQWNKIEPR